MNIGRAMRSNSARHLDSQTRIFDQKNVNQLVQPGKRQHSQGLGGQLKGDERKTSVEVPMEVSTGTEILQYNEKAFKHVPHPEIKGPDREIACADHVDDVFAYLRGIEKIFTIKEAFLNGKATTGKMRAILFDWIVQAHQHLSFVPETLSLAIYILDAYLTTQDVPKTSLQLVAMTSLFVAAKYEEMYTPDIREFEVIGDGLFTKRDIHRLEPQMLMTLDCRLYRPAHITFLRYYTSQLGLPEKVHKRAQFFIEIGIQCYQLCHLRPSHIVFVALRLAAAMEDFEIKEEEKLLDVCELEKAQMEKWRAHLAYAVHINHEHPRLKGISKKYSSSRYLHVSDLSVEKRQWLEKQFEFENS